MIRDRAEINLKLLDKYGKQEKDQGIQFLQWTLGSQNNDYVSYVRGKSNIVEVFDTKTDKVFAEANFSKEMGLIKGLATLNPESYIFKARHIIIDEAG